MSSPSIWEKIDPAVLQQPAVTVNPTPAAADKPDSDLLRRLRRRMRIGNVVGATLWTYGFLKLFVFDLDRMLIERFAPALLHFINLKFFGILALAALIVAITKKTVLWFLYVVFFPFVVAFWYVPYLLYKVRSITLVLAICNVGFGFFRKFKRNFVIRTIEILAVLTLFVFPEDATIAVGAAAVIVAALGYHFIVALVSAFRSSRFLSSQEKLVSGVLNSRPTRYMMSIQPDLRSAEVEKFSRIQLDQFAVSVSCGVVAVRAVDFYVSLLERYRRSGSGLLLAMASFIWLFTQSVVAITLINWTVWDIRPSEFSYSTVPNLLNFAYYSLASVFVNGISGLEPAGHWSVGINLAAGFYGPILLMTLMIQLFFGWKAFKDETAFSDTIREVQEAQKRLESRLEDEYEVPLDVALRKLEEYGIGFVALFSQIAATRVSRKGSGASADGGKSDP